MRLEREPGGERIMVVGDTSYFPKLAGGRMELSHRAITTGMLLQPQQNGDSNSEAK